MIATETMAIYIERRSHERKAVGVSACRELCDCRGLWLMLGENR